MRFAMRCDECFSPVPQQARMAVAQAPKVVGEVLDKGVVHARCEQGHVVTFALHEPAFELRFELASLALLDGYYGEAVLGFTTSLERFYAFAAKLIAARHGAETGVFAEAWRKGVNRAERQLGAFLALYALEKKQACDLKTIEKHTKLRNNVAHEGLIPTYDQAIEYGQDALAFLHRTLRELLGETDQEAMSNIGLAFKVAYAEEGEVAPAPGASLMHVSRSQTVVGLKVPSAWRTGSFADRLKTLQLYRDEWHPA